ncbi:hypothetical protein HY994_01615 [Candidatus Micrarchaeota archaeon]|nr:hypothetical protein [Candidatus Micrarchaeota archaeon]
MLREIQPRSDWNLRIIHTVQAAKKLKKFRVLSAFNAVTDYIKHVDVAKVQAAFSKLDATHQTKALEKSQVDVKHLDTPVDFLAALAHAMRIGKASRIVASPTLLKWLEDTFGEPSERRLGGQAALMAVQLKQLGADASLYPAFLSVDQAKLLEGHVKIPSPVKKKLAFINPLKAARAEDATNASWIFEFKHGQVLQWGTERIETPRDNRLIVSYPAAYVPAFRPDIEPMLPALAKQLDLLIVSGYHALHQKTYKEHLKTITRQLQKMKSANKNLYIHYEFVPFDEEAVEKEVLSQVSKYVDSMGLNEVELVGALDNLGYKKQAGDIEKHESAESLYYGGVCLLQKLGIQRIHIHSLGYNVLILNPKQNAEAARDGAVFGAVAATLKSVKGKLDQKILAENVDLKISEAGYNQLGVFESSVWDSMQKRKRKPISSLLRKQFMSAGIFEDKDHVAIVIPAPVATGLKTTVGLGDVVSGCAVAYELA